MHNAKSWIFLKNRSNKICIRQKSSVVSKIVIVWQLSFASSAIIILTIKAIYLGQFEICTMANFSTILFQTSLFYKTNCLFQLSNDLPIFFSTIIELEICGGWALVQTSQKYWESISEKIWQNIDTLGPTHLLYVQLSITKIFQTN